MDRRSLLKNAGKLALLGATAGNATRPARAQEAQSAASHRARKVRPYDPEWPSAAEWDELRKAVGGRMQRVESIVASAMNGRDAALSDQAVKQLGNPYFIQDHAGGTQSQGWIDAWTSAPSVHAVVPRNATDVAVAVRFAREKNLRLVVKGAGHSYLGQSNAPDSLMIWTRDLDAITLHDAFVPSGCDGRIDPQPAVSVGSGAKFIQLYEAVTTKAGRFVQGGGCTTVGIGGHVQTGGFGSFSRYGGLAATGLIEAEIVTADGEIRVVNACNDPDLFEALRGGGAGFGITTRLTLRTREMPERCGFVGQTIKASSDEAFHRILQMFCAFAADGLSNAHWGEQVTLTPDNEMDIAMVFQGLSDAQVQEIWAPFHGSLAQHEDLVSEASEPRIVSMPGRHWWDYDYRLANFPHSIIPDDREGAAPGRYWWSGNGGEVGIYLSGYESIWLPQDLLDEPNRSDLAQALFDASRHYAVGLHFNKGLSGASEELREEARRSVLHPSAADAFALAIIAGGQNTVFPGVLGHEPDRNAARNDAKRISAAIAELRRVAPEAGSYSSEMSYFEPNWREVAWGDNYARLLATKLKYDPDGVFTGYHQVGSEFWSADGFERRG